MSKEEVIIIKYINHNVDHTFYYYKLDNTNYYCLVPIVAPTMIA